MKKVFVLLLAAMLALSLIGCSKTEKDKDDSRPVLPGSDENEIVEEDETTMEEPEDEVIPEGVEHVNILLMGSKEKDFSVEGNTYCLTHILITLDPVERKIKFTTFPYNLAVKKGEEGNLVQLQEVSMADGVEQPEKVLEENFGIEIDYYVCMNMLGVIEIVNALQGVEIDIQDLSVNEMTKHIAEIFNLAWEEIIETGKQKLSGIQTAGYFNDTITYSDDWMTEEEGYFREHHSNIILGVIESIKLLGFGADDFATVAEAVSANYATNIPKDMYKSIALTAEYCLKNDAEFLHVPQTLNVMQTSSGWQTLGYDEEADTKAVQEFVASK